MVESMTDAEPSAAIALLSAESEKREKESARHEKAFNAARVGIKGELKGIVESISASIKEGSFSSIDQTGLSAESVTLAIKVKLCPTSISLTAKLMLKLMTGKVTGVDSSLRVVSLISDEEREEVTLLQEKANKGDISKKSKGLHIIFLRKNCISNQTGPETGFVGKECKK